MLTLSTGNFLHVRITGGVGRLGGEGGGGGGGMRDQELACSYQCKRATAFPSVCVAFHVGPSLSTLQGVHEVDWCSLEMGRNFDDVFLSVIPLKRVATSPPPLPLPPPGRLFLWGVTLMSCLRLSYLLNTLCCRFPSPLLSPTSSAVLEPTGEQVLPVVSVTIQQNEHLTPP